MFHRLVYRTPYPLWFAGSVVPLALALIGQYGFGLFPCEMCLYQRVPYAVVVALMIVACFWPRHRLLMVLAIIAWLVGAGLAAYHVGIEQGWWESATGCTSNMQAGASLDDLRAAIMNSPIVSCADVRATLLGVSMAGWNVLTSVGLAALGAIWLRKGNKP